MAAQWWQGLGAADVVVECSGAQHTVRWERGRLLALEHADVEGEQALAALAGERPACLELLGLWARHADDLRVLAAASRGPGDPLMLQVDRPRWVAYAPLQSQATSRRHPRALGLPRRTPRRGPPPPGQGTEPDRDPLVQLAELAGPLFDRLACAVAAEWSERINAGDQQAVSRRAALDAALYGRAVLAARSWMAQPTAEVTVEVIAPEELPHASRTEDGLALALPFSWISSVWARGLAVVLGRFVLAASTDDGGRVLLDAVSTDLETRVPIVVSLPTEP